MDAEPGRLRLDEAELDAVLLSALGPHAVGAGDVFAESRLTARLSWRLTNADAVAEIPRVRLDEGLALRVVTPERVAARHVSGADSRALESLAHSDGVGAAGARTAEVRLPPGAGGDRILAAAARALAGRPVDDVLDVELEIERRSVHVVSSEWGHSRSVREWTRVLARGRTGHAEALRGHGAPGLAAPDDATLEALLREALDASVVRSDARPMPPGTRAVVLAPGAGGVLVHEAVGHALEADVVARGASLFSSRVGERVASHELTVLDDPSLPGLAGSHERDDEGGRSRAALLIEGGVLRGLLRDGQRGGFLSAHVTGHGRRASHRDLPLPRMANTQVAAGQREPEEILREVVDGILVTRLERASMDPLTGDFRFRVTEAFRIEDGHATAPVAEAFLLGNAAAVLLAVDAVGRDASWDDGCGTCGREGQWLPVAVGQPTLRVVGGALDVA